jgi:hypothetical protein
MIPILILVSLAVAAPAASQAIVVPVRCQGACPAQLPALFPLDSVRAWANLGDGEANTSVFNVFSNETAGTTDAALFFPLPADATVYRVSVVDANRPAHDPNALLQYNEWSLDDESRWIAEGLMRDRGIDALREYAGTRVVHVSVRDIPPGGRRHVQIQYSQPLRAQDGAIAYRYPLNVGADASPLGDLRLGLEIKTEAGFVDVGSPSHAVDVHWGSESGRCLPQERCGTRGFPSERVRVIRLQPGQDDRGRDFRVVYTPRPAPADRRTVSTP